jgi:protein SCO1/2
MVAATAVASLVLVTVLQNQRSKQMVQVKEGRVIGRPKLGGPYDLIDSEGEVCTDERFRGKYQLIYFGFINCPDICPTELRKLESALKQVPADLASILVPVFISVDPSRDTPEALKKYSADWDRRITWLTGPMDKVAAVAKAFRVYFSVPEIEAGDDNDYLVDHSIFFYLMDRDNKLMEIWGKNTTAEEMAMGLEQQIAKDLIETGSLRGN